MKYKYKYGDKDQDKIIYKSLLFFLYHLFWLEKNELIWYINFIFDINQISKKEYTQTIELILKINNYIYKDKNEIIIPPEEDIIFEELIYNRDLSWFLYALYNLQIESNNYLDLWKYKLLLWDKKITLANETIVIEESLAKSNIEKKISYILGKNIFKEYIEKDEYTNKTKENNSTEIKKKFNFQEYIANKNKEDKYDYDKEIIEIIDRLKDIYENNKVTDYISSLLLYWKVNEKKYKSILFYDLETLISNQEIVSWAFLWINFNKKDNPELFLIMVYNDIAEIKNYNILFKKIFERIKAKAEYKLRKLMWDNKIWMYIMERKSFVNLYEKRIEEDKNIPILSWFNITGFDNPVLFRDKPKLIDVSNKYSLDIFEFLSDVKDKGELNLVAKNNWFWTKLMTHEELFWYLKSEYLNDPKNFDWIAKMILYNIVDTLLTFDILNGYVDKIRKKQPIRWATKMIENIEFKNFIWKKIIN